MQFLSEGTVWRWLAHSSSVQLRFGLLGPGVVPGRFRPVINQNTVYFCCCSCCCLRLSSRIRLWAGSSTPASSRSSSVMSLEKQDGMWETSLGLIFTVMSRPQQFWYFHPRMRAPERERQHVCVYLRNSRSSQPLCRRPCSYLSSPSLCSHSPTEDSPTDKDELLLPQSAYIEGMKHGIN